nr:photosystem I subunit O [Ipomoea batatas]
MAATLCAASTVVGLATSSLPTLSSPNKLFLTSGFGLIGWIAPSSVPLINGKSLTGLFFESIGTELSHWPTGPALTSQFWLAVAGMLAFGVVPVSHFWTDWLQGKD